MHRHRHIGVAILVIGWVIMTYNRLVALRTQVANGWSQIDVQLKRRYDLIPNLVESVKGYMGHEQDTLRNTRTLRGPPLVRWLVWNMSYHTAHHTFPGIPFFALPALNHEIQTRLGEVLPGAGYIGAQVEIAATLLRDGDRMEAVA